MLMAAIRFAFMLCFLLAFRASGVQLDWDSSYRQMLAEEVNQLTGVAVAPDGKVYVSGAFDYVNGVGKQQLVRLNPDGTVDPSFTLRSADGGEVTPWLVRPDGKVLVKLQERLRWMNPNGIVDVAPRIYAWEWQFSGSLDRGELLAD